MMSYVSFIKGYIQKEPFVCKNKRKVFSECN